MTLYILQTIISATQSRKKQQTELVRSVLFAEKDKKRKERENLPITSLPVELLAAQEPSLSNAVQDQDQDEGNLNLNMNHGWFGNALLDSDSEQERPPRTNATIPSVAQALLPSTICASFADIVRLLDDHAITSDGIAVYQVAYQVRSY